MEVDPFYTRDQGPFAQIFGIPPAEGGRLVPPRSLDVRLVLDVSSNDSGGWIPGEALELDGETYRVTLALRHGLANRTEIGLDIPYVAVAAGFLDEFIEDFHNFVGINMAQKSAGKDRLVYSYSRGGVPKVDVRDATSGIGDILLSFGVPLYRSDSPNLRAVSVRAGLKLPTGEADALRGSGGTDFSVRLTATDESALAGWDVTLFGTVGALFPGEGAVLEDQVRRFAGFGSAGFGWRPLDWFVLKIQLDARTAIFRNTDEKVLKSPGFQVVGGGSFALPWGTALDAGLSEVVLGETSPDVTFHVALRKRF